MPPWKSHDLPSKMTSKTEGEKQSWQNQVTTSARAEWAEQLCFLNQRLAAGALLHSRYCVTSALLSSQGPKSVTTVDKGLGQRLVLFLSEHCCPEIRMWRCSRHPFAGNVLVPAMLCGQPLLKLGTRRNSESFVPKSNKNPSKGTEMFC